MILGGTACHLELVEGSRVKALPTMLHKLSMTPIFNYVMGKHEAIPDMRISKEIASCLAMTVF